MSMLSGYNLMGSVGTSVKFSGYTVCSYVGAWVCSYLEFSGYVKCSGYVVMYYVMLSGYVCRSVLLVGTYCGSLQASFTEH